MVAQQGQPANVLVEVLAHRVRQRIAHQATEKAQQQRFAQAEGAAAGQYRDREQQHGAWHDDAGNGQALDAGHQEYRQAKPLRVGAEPASQAVEPLAHGSASLFQNEEVAAFDLAAT